MKRMHIRSPYEADISSRTINLFHSKEPFAEHEILTIQDMLLTPGFHVWNVENVQAGRNLLLNFLRAMANYQQVACFAATNFVLPPTIRNIYTQMHSMDIVCTNEAIESYFIEEFHADFMWIECEQASRKLVEFIVKILSNNNFDIAMPIIFLVDQEDVTSINF